MAEAHSASFVYAITVAQDPPDFRYTIHSAEISFPVLWSWDRLYCA